jgi:Zn-dependent protease with chaperone function
MRPPILPASTLPSDAALAEAPGEPIPGRFFDGRSSRPAACLFNVTAADASAGAGLHVRFVPSQSRESRFETAAPREFAAPDIEWPDAGQTRIAVIRLNGGALVQTMEPARLARALHAAGHAPRGLHAAGQKMAGSWRAMAIGLAVCAAMAFGVALFGVPAAASLLTRAMPPSWETRLGDSTLGALDQTWLKPSALPAAQQAQITADFAALAARAATAETAARAGPVPRYRLVFRSMKRKADTPGGGANAFALPGGTLVMTDELVAVAEPGAVLGVLAHELGHVQHRHATRLAVEGSLLGTLAALISGDVTSVAASVPVMLATLSFSRAHEIEADCHAARLLRRAGESAEPLARLLESIARGEAGVAGVLSSHPGTAARVQLLRNPAEAARICGS